MAGQMKRGIVFLLTLVGSVTTLLAQTATPEPGGSPLREGKRPWMAGRAGEGPNAAAFENVRKALEALTPEQRKRFQENLLRWANLPPKEKEALREREDLRKQVIEEETNTAIQESGLQLDPERREQFMKRYGEGRRQIEEQLRKEMAEKRRPLVHELVNRLKSEFAAEGTPVAPTTSTPSQTTIQTASPSTPVKP